MISTIKATRNRWPIESFVPILLAATLFAVPLSSSAKSILMPLALGLLLFAPAYRQDLADLIYKPWCQASLLLFFMALLACSWSPASNHEKILVLEKYTKLLYFPILVVGFRDPNARRTAMYAFLGAMGLTCLFSILKFLGILHFNGPDPGTVFRNHIMAGHMMGFSAYLSALFFIRQRGRIRVIYATLLVLFSYQLLFISSGRTGYVVYLMLMVLLMVQVLSWRKAALAILLGLSLVTVSYFNSTVMHERVGTAFSNWQHYQENKNTPIGHRMQFHEFAKNLYQRHPWIGNGTGSFTYSFREEKPVPSWWWTLLEPHSQYWLVAAEFGSVGVLLLLFFFGSLLLASFRLQSMRAVAFALILPFMVGNLSDSLLFYSGSGYFFLLFMALCLGEQKSKSI